MVATMNNRTDEIRGVLTAIIDGKRQWENSSEPAILPDTTFWDALDALQAVFSYGDIPEQYRAAERLASTVAGDWERYRDDVQARGQVTLPPPRSLAFTCQAIEDSLQAQDTLPDRMLSSPAYYSETEKLSESQIATVYDWWRGGRVGDPDIGRVRDALADPVLRTKMVENPQWRRALAQREEAQKSIERAIVKARRFQEATEAEREQKAAKLETIEELVGQGLTVAQIAKIYDTSIADVEEQLRSAGLEVGGQKTAQAPYPGSGADDPSLTAAPGPRPTTTVDNDSDEEDAALAEAEMQQNIIDIAAKNPDYGAKDIADIVGCSHQKVTHVLKSVGGR